MGNKVLYYSTDKLYKIAKDKISINNLLALCLIVTLILVVATVISFNKSVVIGSSDSRVKYSEIGNVDYKVYLKDNDTYDSSYLPSGMQYVANLIKTVNVKFNYELHLTDDLDLTNEYKVVGELQITERDDPTSVLYSKKDNLVSSKKISKKDDNFVINEDIDIDYDKYNQFVDDYKRKYGLIVSSNLILTLETNTNGTHNRDKLDKSNMLKIAIPLSEATLKIEMDANNISDSGSLAVSSKFFNLDNMLLFVAFLLFAILTTIFIITDIYIYLRYFDNDPYTTKLNKILRNYDRLIVTGNINLNESKYSNIIYPKTFKEMVDAAQTLGVPIMHYEAIKGEKSFFIVAKDDTLLKYRVTRAYLVNEENEKEKIEII